MYNVPICVHIIFYSSQNETMVYCVGKTRERINRVNRYLISLSPVVKIANSYNNMYITSYRQLCMSFVAYYYFESVSTYSQVAGSRR